jgi:hypothetical protein
MEGSRGGSGVGSGCGESSEYWRLIGVVDGCCCCCCCCWEEAGTGRLKIPGLPVAMANFPCGVRWLSSCAEQLFTHVDGVSGPVTVYGVSVGNGRLIGPRLLAANGVPGS